MIGQKNLLNNLTNLIEDKSFPRFSLLVGLKGSGKKLIVKEIGEMFDAQVVFIEPKVDNIREMISMAYKAIEPTLYVIADADNMSNAGKNALLKVTEEPPQLAYFIMTLQSSVNTLTTIRSRAQIFYTDIYTDAELREYIKKYSFENGEDEEIISVCETPGEIDDMAKIDVWEFVNYVTKVVDNIADVSTTNAFKIGQKIAFKNEEDKYDLRLFWKAFIGVCLARVKEDLVKYAYGIRITSKYLQEIRNASINKSATFDMWLLDIRERWN